MAAEVDVPAPHALKPPGSGPRASGPQAFESRSVEPCAERPRALIITADDFGLHSRVNLAVEQAHRHGVLTAASLMIGAPAANDAVERAHAMPHLRVGLHLVLADGDAVLPRTHIGALLDKHGRFGDDMVRDGVRFFFLPHVREQLAREIRAQFEAFARTGLALDHVNTHKHFHVHPTVLGLILEIGREFGMKAMRLPFESNAPLWLRPWIALVKARLDRAGIFTTTMSSASPAAAAWTRPRGSRRSLR